MNNNGWARFCAVLLLSSGQAAAAVMYSVIPVPGISDTGLQALPTMNQSGVEASSVGPSYAPAGPPITAIAYDYRTGNLTPLGTLGGRNSYGLAINDAGQVTGLAETAGSLTHAFLYSDGVMSDLGTLGGYLSEGFGINNAGEVVGQATASTAAHADVYAFVYSNGVMTNLGTFGGSNSGAYGINQSGQVTGFAELPDGELPHAFLYSSGVMTDLGGLNGSESEGYGINNLGQVVGSSDAPDGFYHAALFSNGVVTDLGTLGGTVNNLHSRAYSINDLGQIVGFSNVLNCNYPGCSTAHGFLYSNGVMTDLNSLIDPSLGIQLTDAFSINNSGQILAGGNYLETYLLTPIPEPATFGPAGMMLLVLGLVRRASLKEPTAKSRPYSA